MGDAPIELEDYPAYPSTMRRRAAFQVVRRTLRNVIGIGPVRRTRIQRAVPYMLSTIWRRHLFTYGALAHYQAKDNQPNE